MKLNFTERVKTEANPVRNSGEHKQLPKASACEAGRKPTIHKSIGIYSRGCEPIRHRQTTIGLPQCNGDFKRKVCQVSRFDPYYLKSFLPLILIAIVLFSCTKLPEKQKVRVKIEYTYQHKEGDTLLKHLTRKLIFKYDKDGKLLKEIVSPEPESLDWAALEKEFGPNCWLSDEEFGRYWVGNEYKYDEKGNLRKMIAHTEVDGTFLFTYDYDNNGKLIEEKSEEFKKIYKYDKQGRLIEELHWFWELNGPPRERYSYEYNDKGKLIKETISSCGGITYSTMPPYDTIFEWDTRKITYKYDEKGNLIEKSDYDYEGELKERYLYRYEKKCLVEEFLLNNVGEPKYKINYKYDKTGNLLIKRKYEYKLKYGEFRPVFVEETLIKYEYY